MQPKGPYNCFLYLIELHIALDTLVKHYNLLEEAPYTQHFLSNVDSEVLEGVQGPRETSDFSNSCRRGYLVGWVYSIFWDRQ